MRKASLIATAILVVLALSAGAFAYPTVAGTHSLSTVHPGTSATCDHHGAADNSTGNETRENETSDHEDGSSFQNETANGTEDHGSPSANETENETANGPSDCSVTGAHDDGGSASNDTELSSPNSAVPSASDSGLSAGSPDPTSQGPLDP